MLQNFFLRFFVQKNQTADVKLAYIITFINIPFLHQKRQIFVFFCIGWEKNISSKLKNKS